MKEREIEGGSGHHSNINHVDASGANAFDQRVAEARGTGARIITYTDLRFAQAHGVGAIRFAQLLSHSFIQVNIHRPSHIILPEDMWAHLPGHTVSPFCAWCGAGWDSLLAT